MFTLLGVKTRAVGCLNIWATGAEMPAPAGSGELALCHAEPGPSVLVRPVGRHFPEPRARQELPTICSMIAVVDTDGVRGRYTT